MKDSKQKKVEFEEGSGNVFADEERPFPIW